MSRKHTLEEFNEYIKRKNIKLLEYKGLNAKTDVLCLVCNNTWNTTPYSVRNSSGCPKCEITRRHLSLDEINKKIKTKNIICESVEYKIIIGEKRLNSHRAYGKFKCLVCNYKWDDRLDHIMDKTRKCPNCFKIKQLQQTKSKKEEFNLLLKNKGSFWEVVGDYLGMDNKTLCKCNQCGKTFNMRINQIYYTKSCQKCYFKRKRISYLTYEQDRNNYKKYRTIVSSLTSFVNKKYTKFSEIGHNHYHIDHMCSVRDCFKNNILPEIVASPPNIRKIWCKANMKKQANSLFDTNELLQKYEIWLKENPDYMQDVEDFKLQITKLNVPYYKLNQIINNWKQLPDT